MADLSKLVKKLAEGSKTAATAILEHVKTPEQAVALKGPEREAYLKALDAVHGPAEKRASDMGFDPENYYHGSFRNIKKFNPEKSSPEGYMGKTTYLTNDPSDASWNYAAKDGPDHEGKLERLIKRLQNEKNLNYTAASELAEKKLFGRVDSGAVYPVKVRPGNTADLTPDSNQYVDLSPVSDDAGDYVSDNPIAEKIVNGIKERASAAESRLEGERIADKVELYDEKQPAEIFNDVANASMDLSDNEGNLLNREMGRGALEDMGYDSVRINADHEFNMPNMKKGTEHLMVHDPARLRSKFAAFDPRFKDSDLLLAAKTGATADPRAAAVLSKYMAPQKSIKEAYGDSLQNNEMLAKLTGTGKFKDSGRESEGIGESIDSLTGVPLRTAISEAQSGNFNLDAARKIAASIGSDPRTAPSGYDIASKVTDNPILGAALATGVDVANLPLPVKPGVSATVGKVAEKARKAAAAEQVITHIKSKPALQTALEKLSKGEQIGFQTGVDTHSQAKIKQLAQDLALKSK